MSSPITVECEIRALVSDEQYGRLAAALAAEGVSEGEDEQVTYYFEGHDDPDLRIQKNGAGAKIWMKRGQMHDEAREEIEIPCRGESFDDLEALFTALGYRVSIKWFRRRLTFRLGDITATLDDTRGYGKIVELEKLCAPEGREAALAELKAKMETLGIVPTPKEAFDLLYRGYKHDWRRLVGEAA